MPERKHHKTGSGTAISLKRIPAALVKALDALGLPWRIEMGRRHYRIMTGAHQLGVLSFAHDESRNGMRSLIGAVKREARKIQNSHLLEGARAGRP